MLTAILGSDKVNSSKNTEINKQSLSKFWLYRKKHGAVSYLSSCTIIKTMVGQKLQNIKSIKFQPITEAKF